ncbi:probable serine/threonine-protein kinase DDB_G0271402 [Medicago truncatula]|uniref:probable serine/threonine-protein kinase DDB_G0271402 n=1 Tax=Medicago truncatula TaxID=3880 RepID=UPI0000F6F931|nr:probable serine/threonine-protein kinase DDB_G0271402 [Medicago truncatula]
MNSERFFQWMNGYNTTPKINTHSSFNSDSSSSAGINNFGSHAPGIKKAMQILEAQFGHLQTSTSSININDDIINNNNKTANNNNNKMMKMNTSTTSSHLDLHVGLSSQLQELPSQTINLFVTDVRDINKNDKRKKKKSNENIDDGKIHSLPHEKHGPYPCSQCNKIFETSQKFANHVSSSHYKFESEEDRKKRYNSRIRKRPRLQIQKLNDGRTTFVPVVACADKSHASINNDDHNMISLTPLPSGIKVKSEPSDN